MGVESRVPSAWRNLRTGFFVFVPPILLILGLMGVPYFAANPVSVGLLAAFYLATSPGIGIFYHRYATHGAFSIRYSWLIWVLGVLAAMAGQGSIFDWVADHRLHHGHTDEKGDPHSPYVRADGTAFRNRFEGFWHAHTGWLFVTPKAPEFLTARLRKSALLRHLDRCFVAYFVAGLVLPILIGALLRHSFAWWAPDLVWGGLIRMSLGHHVTWSVNSVCHMWGNRPFQTNDKSTDNVWVAMLAFGEGYHNKHHADEKSAKHGGIFDLNWQIIRFLHCLGCVGDVYNPTKAQIRLKLVAQGLRRHSA